MFYLVDYVLLIDITEVPGPLYLIGMVEPGQLILVGIVEHVPS